MPRFKIVSGTHIRDGKSYTKGELIISQKDLTINFPGKFIRVQQVHPPAKEGEPEGKEEDWEEVEPAEPTAAVKLPAAAAPKPAPPVAPKRKG
jgi:hypothetical protein